MRCSGCTSSAQSAERRLNLAPRGKEGYKLMVTKQWVVKLSKLLAYTLKALEVISLLTPLALPHLSDLSQYLPKELASIDIDLSKEVPRLKDAVSKAQKMFDSKVVVNQGAQGVIASAATTSAVTTTSIAKPERTPVITVDCVQSLIEILQLVEGKEMVLPPKHSGLSRAICSAKGHCAWVCEGEGEGGGEGGCKGQFEEKGNDCLGVNIERK